MRTALPLLGFMVLALTSAPPSLAVRHSGHRVAGPQTAHTRSEAASARAVIGFGHAAAESGTLSRYVSTWRAVLSRDPRNRLAQLALATSERLRYRYAVADSLYRRIPSSTPRDDVDQQASLGRATIFALQGRIADAASLAQLVELDALRATDTLTAIDALLLRIATTMRSEGASAAMRILQRVDSLRPARDASTAAIARCRASGIYSRLGNRTEARRAARDGIAIATRAKLQRTRASCLFTLATDFARSGLTDSLRAPLQQAITLQQQTGDLAGLAASSQWAGYYSASLGHYSAAQQHLTTAWDAAQRAGVADVAAWTALNRGALAQSFFDAAAANLWISRADSLMRSVDDAQGQVDVARMRAAQARAIGNIDGARAALQRALSVAERIGEPSGRLAVSAALRDLEMSDGKLDEAERWLRAERALIAQYQMAGFEISHTASTAALALRRGDARTALPLLDQTLARLAPSQHEFRYATRLRRSLALGLLGDPKRAAREALEAAETLDRWRGSLSDSTLRLLAFQSQRAQGWFSGSLTSLLAASGESAVAFSVGERRRARELDERLVLSHSWSLNDSLVYRKNRVDASFSVAELQASLPDPYTAYLTLEAGESGAPGTAFVLTRQALTSHTLPAGVAIAPRVRRLLALLESGGDDGAEAQAVGAELLWSLRERLDGDSVQRLIIVAEGGLARVPFDVLRWADGRRMAERFAITVAPSATVFARLRSLPPPAPRLAASLPVLALGDADAAVRSRTPAIDSSFGGRLRTLLFGNEHQLPPLPGARTEIAHLRKRFPATTAFTGALAREQTVKRAGRQVAVLHFATHASVDEGSGARAALALSPSSTEDGMLESAEIGALRLGGALVVLSACRTVGGEIVAGEGVRGLTSAFLEAGARTVLATAWRVDDRAIAPLVADFYDALATGETVSVSLQRARARAIERGVPARVWGAFVVVGDPWRTVVQPSPSVSLSGKRAGGR
ncbi:MAG: CHAT domain-containing protein [Gemmatimonadaceae bacterium]|nr:CHAT domain-containing protein [Gemmatimonadaceae bacterium]